MRKLIRIVMRIVTIACAAAALIGAMNVDSEGTFLPHILTIVGLGMTIILSKFYWKIIE